MSIPMITFDTDNYGTINHMKYNPRITNNDKMENKSNLKSMILNVGEINISNISTEYIRKYKRNLSGVNIQRESNKCTKGSTLHFKKHCRVTDAIVELVDIFPTIADLAGIPIPICQINDANDDQSRSRNVLVQKETLDPCGEGITLLPLIKSTLECQVRHTFYCIINYTNILYKTEKDSLSLYNLSSVNF